MTARRCHGWTRLIAALVATEQWQFEEIIDATPRATSTQPHGDEDRGAAAAAGPCWPTRSSLESGERRELAFEVPVPAARPGDARGDRQPADLGPRGQARPAGELDSAIVVPVVVLQPTALLRAGVVGVEEFALYEAADSATDVARGTVEIKPMPICVGAPIDGHLTIETSGQLDLQEVRLEIRVKAQATVSSGLDEELTLGPGGWLARGSSAAPRRSSRSAATSPATYLPTIELPHGRTDATFHVILARAWAATRTSSATSRSARRPRSDPGSPSAGPSPESGAGARPGACGDRGRGRSRRSRPRRPARRRSRPPPGRAGRSRARSASRSATGSPAAPPGRRGSPPSSIASRVVPRSLGRGDELPDDLVGRPERRRPRRTSASATAVAVMNPSSAAARIRSRSTASVVDEPGHDPERRLERGRGLEQRRACPPGGRAGRRAGGP